MPWRPIEDLSRGLDLLNDEHDAQFCLVAAARKAVISGIDARVSDGLLSMVLHSVRTHALTEERLMQIYAFPDGDGHGRRHHRLVGTARAVLDAFRSGREERAADHLDDFALALNGHIGDEDAALRRHLLRLLPGHVDS